MVGASPAIFHLNPVEATKGSRVLSILQDFRITGEWNATSAPKNHRGSCASKNRDKGTPPNQRVRSFPVRAIPTIFPVNQDEDTKGPRGLSTLQDP